MGLADSGLTNVRKCKFKSTFCKTALIFSDMERRSGQAVQLFETNCVEQKKMFVADTGIDVHQTLISKETRTNMFDV